MLHSLQSTHVWKRTVVKYKHIKIKPIHGPTEVWFETTSRSVQPICRARGRNQQTHRNTQGEVTSQYLWSRYDRHFVGKTWHNVWSYWMKIYHVIYTHTYIHTYIHTYTRLTALCPWHQLGCIHVCTSLQTDNHASTSPLSFFTGRMPYLPPNQQRQSTEGKDLPCYLNKI